jgi:hypothetical protein
MAIQVVDTVTGTGNFSAFGTLFPTPATGDLEIVLVLCAGVAWFDPPAGEGWTTVVDVVPDRRLRLSWRIAPSATKSSLFNKGGEGTTTTTAYTHAHIRGHDLTDPIDVADAQGSATTGTSITSPSLTPDTAGLYLTQFGAAGSGTANTSLTLPAGMTGGEFVSVTYTARPAWEQLTSNGATGTRVGTLVGGAARPPHAVACVVRPAQSSGFFPFF